MLSTFLEIIVYKRKKSESFKATEKEGIAREMSPSFSLLRIRYGILQHGVVLMALSMLVSTRMRHFRFNRIYREGMTKNEGPIKLD
jgi:hypothetical protein